MKRLSPGKLRIIIVLNFVAIALLLGLFFFLPPDSQPASGQPEEHQRIRTASISLNPSLSWELQLCGSGEETAVASFVRGGYVYIFGNTGSDDLDFDHAGIFLSIVDVYGVTKAFFVYGDEGDTLKSVCLCEGGFLLAVEGKDSPRLLVVDFTGEVKKNIDGFLYGFERVLNVKSYRDGYLLFTAPENNLTGIRSLRCSFFSSGLTFNASNIAVSSYSLDLFDSAVISGRAVAICNAVSTLHTVPATVEFSQYDSPKIKIFTAHAGAVKGFSVYDGDFLLLTAQDGSSLLQIDTGGTIQNKTTLSQLRPLALSEVGPLENGTQYYLAFLDTAIYLINGKGERKSTLPAFIPNARAYYNDIVIFSSDGVSVNVYSNEKVIFGASMDSGKNPILAVDENNLFCVYESGGEVFICKLRYPIFW